MIEAVVIGTVVEVGIDGDVVVVVVVELVVVILLGYPAADSDRIAVG